MDLEAKTLRDFIKEKALNFMNQCITEDFKSGNIYTGKKYDVSIGSVYHNEDRGFSIITLKTVEKTPDGSQLPSRTLDVPFFHARRNWQN